MVNLKNTYADASVVKNRRGSKSVVSYSGKHKINGVKRHIMVDSNGNPLSTRVTRASTHDSQEAIKVIDRCKIGKKTRRPKRCGMDKGYDSDSIRLALRKRGIIPCIAERSDRKKPTILTKREKTEKKFSQQRWKVERTFSWLNNSRRIGLMYERTLSQYHAFLTVACIKHYLRLLA